MSMLNWQGCKVQQGRVPGSGGAGWPCTSSARGYPADCFALLPSLCATIAICSYSFVNIKILGELSMAANFLRMRTKQSMCRRLKH